MFKYLKNDLPSSIVVFFVALPLCLGIALASGAPLFSGLIAGIVGGIVVGSLSGSRLGVSGPAAGLAAIVLAAIGTLGSYQNFLVAVVLAGIIQIIFGVLKAGVIGYYFPSSVIKGMLTGIGIIIILKQIPHFFGYDSEPEGADSFIEASGENTFSAILHVFDNVIIGSLIVGVVGLAVILIWDNILAKKAKVFTIIQGPLVAVVIGIVFYSLTSSSEALSISQSHLVSVPIPEDATSFFKQFSFPNFSAIMNTDVWVVAFTIALVASLETLLSVEATDKLDPEKHVTPTNRELLAQGTGNIISGLIGGLPITQVIVRSSANVQSGGKTKMSAIIHGFLLLISVILIPRVLNKIPLSVLAAVLLVVGYKLAKPTLFKKMYNMGWKQFVPFIVTVVGIVFTDLLVGISLGLLVGIIVILLKSYQNSHFLHIEDKSNGKHKIKMTLAEEVTFFNKGAILKELHNLPENTYLELNLLKTRYLDNDVIEILDDFAYIAKDRHIDIQLVSKRGVVENPESFEEFFRTRPKSSLSLS
ncbi:SulP family inorganic anion transporter [Tamlana fucoidanivorans]|uniref:SulP family inorganic anion transporter n=1 Tax=Allotamlana fucoidanivorans TaxID=2583814 RepID=A0A5C4SS26_9FLAO|nr:SulP family inorganic anion transporter [Tamlana fucoidanivorans]TNJ47203.1 SulP family inorganic anion transporter [Tamlana fucoidanivorans]